MSEVDDSFLYNLYDYVKSIYIYSHVKTNLIDPQRQPIEKWTNYAILGISMIFFFFSIFKVFVIIFYFFILQAFAGFIKFLRAICKTRCRINCCSSCKNAIYYLYKVLKRIYTFNFYSYQKRLIGFLMIFSYFFFLGSSSLFYIYNIKEICFTEKSTTYLILFYCHFQSILFLQLMCSSFYSCRDINSSTKYAFGLFVSMNGILFLGYFITNEKENIDGSYDFGEPQAMMNIIFGTILLCVNLMSFSKIIRYKKNGKYLFLI